MLDLNARRLKWLKKELAKAEKAASRRKTSVEVKFLAYRDKMLSRLASADEDIAALQLEIEELEKKG